MYSYADGNYVATDELALPVASDILGTFRGYRNFTACITAGKKIFHLDDHVARIFRSAKNLHMPLPHTPEQLKEILQSLVRKNSDNLESGILIEIIYTGGNAKPFTMVPKGKPRLYVAVFPSKKPPREWYTKGIKLATYPYQRQWPETKLLNYIAGVLAHQTVVQERGAKEVLFVTPDKKRRVLEGATFNFFMMKDGAVITHPLDGAVLPGITRKVILQLARDQGIPVREEHFSLTALNEADEAAMCSSTRDIVPVVAVDDIKIGTGKPGPITKKLAHAFQEYFENY